MMYCAECGSKMSKHEHGAWVLCCNGYGYWWSQPPSKDDEWWPLAPPVNGYWFYKTMFWPKGQKPVSPSTSGL